MVELAALDIQKCPLDKLRCLRSTLDYIEAEIKRSIADTHNMASSGKSKTNLMAYYKNVGMYSNFNLVTDEAPIPPITSGDMRSLLTAVLIQAKPQHLATNLNYIEFYQHTLSPCDPLWYEASTLMQFNC